MSQQTPTYKITVLNGVSLQSPVMTDNTMKSSTNKTITLPAEGTLATIAGTETLTNKTLTTPVIASLKPSASGKTITFTAAANDTAVLLAETQTLTNKTLTSPTISSIVNGGATLTMPSTTGTLALQADVNAQKQRIDRLVAYLSTWINVGNLSMADISSAVDPSS